MKDRSYRGDVGAVNRRWVWKRRRRKMRQALRALCVLRLPQIDWPGAFGDQP